MTDLPDYTKYIVQAPRDSIAVTLDYGDLTVQPMLMRPAILDGVNVKTKEALVTDYLKQCCIKPPYVTVAGPSGTMNSYEGGYMCRALIYKAGAGEQDLARDCLDHWVTLQKTNGSWSQSYYPSLNAASTHDEMADLQVDSGTAVLCWAMADYDNIGGGGGTRYKTVVQKGMAFLKDLQTYMQAAQGVKLLSNMVQSGVYDDVALYADSGECLLAITAVLDAYGGALLDSNGESVAAMGNDLYEAIGQNAYAGDAGRYFFTGYPDGAQPLVTFTYKEKLVVCQALTAWALYVWYHSAYNTKPDYTAACEKVLDATLCLSHGKWGGFLYSPYFGQADETRYEYVTYTALMVMAMDAVNSSKYANYITAGNNFLKWLHLGDGRCFDFVRTSGELDVGRVLQAGIQAAEEFGWLSLNPALALLAGA